MHLPQHLQHKRTYEQTCHGNIKFSYVSHKSSFIICYEIPRLNSAGDKDGDLDLG